MNDLTKQKADPSDGKPKAAAEAKGTQPGAMDNAARVAAAIKRGRKPAFTVDRLLLPHLVHEMQRRVELAKPEQTMTTKLTLPLLLADDMIWGAVIQMNVKGIGDAIQVKIIMDSISAVGEKNPVASTGEIRVDSYRNALRTETMSRLVHAREALEAKPKDEQAVELVEQLESLCKRRRWQTPKRKLNKPDSKKGAAKITPQVGATFVATDAVQQGQQPALDLQLRVVKSLREERNPTTNEVTLGDLELALALKRGWVREVDGKCVVTDKFLQIATQAEQKQGKP